MRFFASGFFHESSFSKPLKIRLGSFQNFKKNSARRYLRYTTGINDTNGKFAACVNYTGGKFDTGINNTSGKFENLQICSLQISSANRKSANWWVGLQNLLHLQTFCKSGICAFAICGTYEICEFGFCRSMKINMQI
jgi:hypothetical protein